MTELSRKDRVDVSTTPSERMGVVSLLVGHGHTNIVYSTLILSMCAVIKSIYMTFLRRMIVDKWWDYVECKLADISQHVPCT